MIIRRTTTLIAMLLLQLLMACVTTYTQQYGKQLRWVTQWKSLDFVFPSPKEREDAIASRRFIPTNCIPLDMDVDYNSSKLPFNSGSFWSASN